MTPRPTSARRSPSVRQKSAFVLGVCLSFIGSCGDTYSDLITANKEACASNASCTASARPVCDKGTAQCRACGSDAECIGPSGAYCDLASGACVECLSREHCDDPSRPICSEHRCVECVTSAHCASPDQGCNVISGLCSPVCDTSSICPFDFPRCDMAVNFCVECLTDADCTMSAFPLCRLSTCVPADAAR